MRGFCKINLPIALNSRIQLILARRTGLSWSYEDCIWTSSTKSGQKEEDRSIYSLCGSFPELKFFGCRLSHSGYSATCLRHAVPRKTIIFHCEVLPVQHKSCILLFFLWFHLHFNLVCSHFFLILLWFHAKKREENILMLRILSPSYPIANKAKVEGVLYSVFQIAELQTDMTS